MNRLGIFCFFDQEGIVDNYIEFLLKDLCCCLSSLIIVVNGKVNDQGKIVLERYADELYVRDNKGYDGGAYKDVLSNILGWSRVEEFDELVLCNDTFYGPLVPFESIFDEMNNNKVDFWGMSYYFNRITNHLQSYFLVFRKRILDGNFISAYFEESINTTKSSIADVYGEFEFGLYCYLIKNGYSFSSYSKNFIYDINRSSNFCIKESNLPILKKKSFSPKYFMQHNIMDVLKYLCVNTNYNVNLVLDNIRRLYDLKITRQEIEEFNPDKVNLINCEYDVSRVSSDDIIKLIIMKKDIYIYGLGAISAMISSLINIYQGHIAGYIVSDNQYNMPEYKNGVIVYRVSEMHNRTNMVVIVALNKEHTQEVTSYLKKFKEVIFLW